MVLNFAKSLFFALQLLVYHSGKKAHIMSYLKSEYRAQDHIVSITFYNEVALILGAGCLEIRLDEDAFYRTSKFVVDNTELRRGNIRSTATKSLAEQDGNKSLLCSIKMRSTEL